MKNPFIINVITDMANISSLLNSFFKNEQKTTMWLNIKNHLLGDVEPIKMIFSGRTEKLQDFIEKAIEENEL